MAAAAGVLVVVVVVVVVGGGERRSVYAGNFGWGSILEQAVGKCS